MSQYGTVAYYYGINRHNYGMSPQEAMREAKSRVVRDQEEREHRHSKGYGRFEGHGPEAGRFSSLREIEEANRRAGQHWFEKDTMRFFKSKVLGPVYGGHYFVSSEKGPHGGRAYSVRKATRHGKIETVGKFQQYTSAAQARRAIERLVKRTKVSRSR